MPDAGLLLTPNRPGTLDGNEIGGAMGASRQGTGVVAGRIRRMPGRRVGVKRFLLTGTAVAAASLVLLPATAA